MKITPRLLIWAVSTGTHVATGVGSALTSDRRTSSGSCEADARTRTADPFITSEVLYQLSYVGAAWIVAASAWRKYSASASRPEGESVRGEAPYRRPSVS